MTWKKKTGTELLATRKTGTVPGK